MDRIALMVEMPILSDEAAMGIYHFLQEITLAFESRYFCQLRRYNQNAWRGQPNNPTEE